MPLDPLFTDLDANQVSEALRRALQIKGQIAAPGKMNIQQLQPTVDELQGGFSIYEILNGEESISATGALQVLDVFDPTANVPPDRNQKNNRDFEIRMLYMEVQIEGLDALDYADNDRLVLTVRQEMQGFGSAIDGIRSVGISWIKRWKANLAPDNFIWAIPSTASQGTGGDELSAVNNWQGWIPAGSKFSVRVDSPDVNFSAGANLEARYQAIRVPKGCRLPV